jgi:hypothetical protein
MWFNSIELDSIWPEWLWESLGHLEKSNLARQPARETYVLIGVGLWRHFDLGQFFEVP